MDKFLTRNELASLLRVTPTTISAWIKQGRIKASRVGRKLLFDEQEISKAMRLMEGDDECKKSV